MTKKDYELIASVLKDYNPYKNMSARDNFEILCFDMSSKLASKNPRFNREKFLKACGVEVEEDIWCKLSHYNETPEHHANKCIYQIKK